MNDLVIQKNLHILEALQPTPKDSMDTCSIAAVDALGNEFVLSQHTDQQGQVVISLGGEQLHVYQDNGVWVAVNRNGRKFFIEA